MHRRWLWAVAVSAGLAAVVTVSGQQVTFRARREVIRVDVLVSDHAKPVRDLRASDFEIKDNGVAQDVDFASFDELPINVILELDMSNSVAGDRLQQLRRASRALLDGLKKDDRAGLISFSHSVDLGAALTTDRAKVLASLDDSASGGATSLVDASYAGLVMGETDQGRSVLIAFSDGVDTSSWLTPEAVLDTGKRARTVVYGVSVRGSNPQFLRDLTGATGGSVFEVESTRNLDATFVKLLEEFRQRYVIAYSPKGVANSGWHRLEVRVRNRNYTTKARPGYLTGNAGDLPATVVLRP